MKMWPSQTQGIFHVLQPIMDFNVIYRKHFKDTLEKRHENQHSLIASPKVTIK